MGLRLIRLAAEDGEAYRDGCCSRLYDIFRNPSICLSLKSGANEERY